MHTSLLFLLIIYFLRANAVQRIVHGPENTVVKVGQIAVLRCQVADQVGSVQWTKDSFGLGTDREIKQYGKRYRMTGTISEGEYNLEIQNVSVEDDNVYECQLSGLNMENPPQVSAPARLTVIAEPSNPTLGDSQEVIKSNEDSPVRVSCTSRYGRPAARIVWVVSSDPEAKHITSYVNNASEVLKEVGIMPNHQKTFEFRSQEKIREDNKGIYTVISEIDFIPSKEDDGRYLSCVALHPTYEGKVRVSSAALSVRYKPKVQVQLDENGSDLREGGRAFFKCLVDAKPKMDTKIMWHGLEDRLRVTGAQTAIVENLKMEDHLSQVFCSARNEVGTSRSSATLKINFAPRIMSTSQTRIAHSGESVTFHCEANGNPPPRISWYRAGATNRDEMLARGNVLTLDSINADHVGQYECVAHSKGNPPARLRHYLHLKGPPIIRFGETEYVSPNRIVLTCGIHSKPNPNKIVWSKNGKELEYADDQSRFALKESSREFGVESKLTIDQVKESDYGTYNCTAWNEFGSRSSTIDVSAQSLLMKVEKLAIFYAAKIPWFVWTVAVFILFVLLLLCCILSCCSCCGRKQGCCRRGDNLKPTKFSDCSDVTVRCEALDHDAQHYFPDMFTTSPPLDSSSELLSKDYIPIPQSNPDFDYLPDHLPPPVYGSYYQHPYGYNNVMECSPNEINLNHPSSTFSSYNSPIMGQDIFVPVYNSNRNNHVIRQLNVAPLEPLHEVDTPTADNILLADNNRAPSRVSTHV